MYNINQYIYISQYVQTAPMQKKQWTWAIKIPRLPLSNTKIKCHQRWIFDHQASGHGPFLWSSIVGRKHTGDHSQTHIYLRRQGLALAQKKEATSMPRSHSGVSFWSENPRWSNNLQGGNEYNMGWTWVYFPELRTLSNDCLDHLLLSNLKMASPRRIPWHRPQPRRWVLRYMQL